MRGSRVGLLMLALAMSSAMEPAIPACEIRKRDDMEPWERNGKPDTVNTGRRAEKDAAALAKAEAKRARKAAKRTKDASYNAAVSGRGETKPGEKDGGCTASA